MSVMTWHRNIYFSIFTRAHHCTHFFNTIKYVLYVQKAIFEEHLGAWVFSLDHHNSEVSYVSGSTEFFLLHLQVEPDTITFLTGFYLAPLLVFQVEPNNQLFDGSDCMCTYVCCTYEIRTFLPK